MNSFNLDSRSRDRVPRIAALAVVCALAFGIVGRDAGRAAAPPEPISYVLRMPAPANHIFEVQITTHGTPGEPVDFQMPAWSPGRYVINDFARFVQNVAAVDGRGSEIPVQKIDKQTWRTTPRSAGEVTLNYRVFADGLSGTFSQFNTRHANINGPSVFMYVAGRKDAPVRLRLEAPGSWRIESSASASPRQTDFTFASYDELADTPIEAAERLDVAQFDADGCAYRVVVHQIGEREPIGRYSRDVRRIVEEQFRILARPFDLKRYTFIVHTAPANVLPDGMEHFAGSQIVFTDELEEHPTPEYVRLLALTAHEHFHLWNAKRLRPRELGPFDYTRENYTTSLWIVEGVTSYYADLTLARAGLITAPELLDRLSQQVSAVESRPGRLLMNLERASFDTWLHFVTPRKPDAALDRATIDYYEKGEVVAMLLDLAIREKTGGARSLDDVMRLMMQRFYYDAPAESYFGRGRGYTGADFLAAVNEVSGSDFGPFFDRYVRGTDELDYDAALEPFGLRIERERRISNVEYGVRFKQSSGRLVVESIEYDGLAARGGLRKGDIVVRIDGAEASASRAREVFGKGSLEPVTLAVVREGSDLDIVVPEVPSRSICRIVAMPEQTPDRERLRTSWLTAGVKHAP